MQSNKDIKFSINSEKVVDGRFGTTNTIGMGFRKGRNTEVSLKKRELYKSLDHKGEHWKYPCDNNKFDKNF